MWLRKRSLTGEGERTGSVQQPRMSRARRVARYVSCLMVTLALAGAWALAQESWQPDRNVTMVVPFSAGGGSDIFGRALAAGIEEVRPGVTVAVENRTGGSGAIGYSYLLQQNGDGHYLLPSETSAISLPLTTEVAFHWTDFTPIAQVAEDAVMMVVREDSEYESVQDVIAAGQEQSVLLGIAGVNGVDSINGALLEQAEDMDFQRVVFQSGGELIVALLAGDIEVAMMNPGEVISYVESGDARPILVFAQNRYDSGVLADVPTSIEEGIDVAFSQYRGPYAAGGLTDAQRQYWIDTFREYTQTESYQQYLADNYLIETTRFGDDFVSFLEKNEADMETALEALQDE